MEGNFVRQFNPPYAVLYVIFSPPRNFLHFPEEFSVKIHKIILQNTEMSLKISNIFRQNQTELQLTYFQ